jgi:hypothetical protein
MVCMMRIWVVHIWFCEYVVPITIIHAPEICGTDNELCAFGTKIPFSHINANSLHCCKMFCFIRVVAICKKNYSLDWNTVIKKIVNFRNLWVQMRYNEPTQLL